MTSHALRRSPLLEELSDRLLDELADHGDTVDLGDGAMLMEEGSPADAMFIVLDGALEVRKRLGDGEVVLGRVGPGELVGELALVHGRPRSASLRVVGSARLRRIRGDALDDLLARPGVGRAVLATATRRMENQELLLRQHGRMAALGTLTAGLLHELNNPAAAVSRATAQLTSAVEDVDAADRALSRDGEATRREQLARLLAAAMSERGTRPRPTALARADAEEELHQALLAHGVERAGTLVGPLADAGIEPDDLRALLGGADADVAQAAVSWFAARLTVVRLLDEAASAAGRISEIVGAVKRYAHHDEAPVQDVDVHDGLEAALTLLRHKTPPGVEIVRRYASDLPRIDGHPGDLNGVWTNLLDNALDVVGEAGQIELVTAADDDHVTVAVIDDGPGIPADVVDRIFDPFFTTKPVGAGTGLGLATAHAVITQRHRGHIAVDSRPGRTAITVTLPRRADAPPSAASPSADTAQPAQSS